MDQSASVRQRERAKLRYRREGGKRLTYDIEVDQHGNFVISLDGKVLKQGTDILVRRGLRRPGLKVQANMIEYAKATVAYLQGMKEE